jgi:hypothetical protein
LEARYRVDYPGEFVVVETKWSGGKKQQVREWIANPIENHHISGRAACIGHTSARTYFNYTILQRHRGGLLGSKKLQTYGVGNVAYTMKLDFAVESDAPRLDKLVESNYTADNIVYTTAKNCITHPGIFYLVPLRPRLLDAAMIVYMAAFDGHKEIFLLGYTFDDLHEDPALVDNLKTVFKTYSGTKFYLIGEKTRIAPEYFDCPNVAHYSYRDFVGYCDV